MNMVMENQRGPRLTMMPDGQILLAGTVITARTEASNRDRTNPLDVCYPLPLIHTVVGTTLLRPPFWYAPFPRSERARLAHHSTLPDQVSP